jgi:hypothetical protein
MTTRKERRQQSALQHSASVALRGRDRFAERRELHTSRNAGGKTVHLAAVTGTWANATNVMATGSNTRVTAETATEFQERQHIALLCGKNPNRLKQKSATGWTKLAYAKNAQRRKREYASDERTKDFRIKGPATKTITTKAGHIVDPSTGKTTQDRSVTLKLRAPEPRGQVVRIAVSQTL